MNDKINIVVGLPGSGKTHFMNEKSKDGDVIIDDIDTLNDIIEYISKCNIFNDCWISDVNFCDGKILKKAIAKIKDLKHLHELGCGHKYDIVVHYFENNPSQCEKNIEYRIEHEDDTRNVNYTLNRFKTIYDPPKDAMKIFDTDKKKNLTIWD